MKLITEIVYENVEIYWIEDFYDMALSGLCHYENKLCYFETKPGQYDDEIEEWEDSFTKIFRLSIIEKAKWLFVAIKWNVFKIQTKSRWKINVKLPLPQ